MLHGPYIKRIDDQTIEEGFFYFGLKHGRWVRLNRSDILQDKETYFMGWLNESIRFFWDPKKENLKEKISKTITNIVVIKLKNAANVEREIVVTYTQ